MKTKQSVKGFEKSKFPLFLPFFNKHDDHIPSFQKLEKIHLCYQSSSHTYIYA